nr:YbbR-like domain-containing protein [uncultured Marinifilum sp.]
MDNFDFEKLKEFFDKEKIKSNKKLLAYLFFVALSTIFWFLNALSKEYTTSINYPVNYINLPQEKVLVGELPAQLDLRVQAYGFDLLRYKLSTAFLSNPFDVNKYTKARINNSINAYPLVTSGITKRLERELSSGIQLLSISPDTIHFLFSPIVEKKIPVKLNSSIDFAQQFMQKESIFIEPDSVLVKGAGSILDSVFVAETENLLLTNLKKTAEKNVGILKTEGLEILPSKVKVTVPVVRFTEAQKIVPIKVDNLPDSMILRLFPGDVKMSYFVGMNKYESISEDHFDLRVNYETAAKGEVNKLKIELKRSPEFVSNVRFYPQSVSFLIEKRKSLQ